MGKRIIKFSILAFFIGFIISCATISTPYWLPSEDSLLHQEKFIATQFPEVNLFTSNGDLYHGKMTVLEGETVIFSPSPYWNVERLRIKIDDIETIELPAKKTGAAKGFGYGFGVTCILIGGFGAGTSKYNETFQNYAVLTPVAGLLGGLAGMVIGAITDLATPAKIEFFRLRHDQKIKVLASLMGLSPVSNI